ncbi:serine hydrolase domain-containing protein [Psychroserpens luteolus]|uniref:serine hydrolase domain-containing protein n=1 Tax=Psychroserpens luteolus TaxID=2855840 RepID=UPI001E3C6145|nr:serine hydrolase [Psychroserpens luteolus]MCD2258835.1 beta-lactamase family protein [Psychroserpens luteolus]
MKKKLGLLLLIVLFLTCKNEPKKNTDILNTGTPKYETYNYSGFTKEEIYGFHKRIYEGGNWTEYGDLERYFYLNFSEIKKHSRILRADTPKILEETPRDDVKHFITPANLKKGGGLSLNDYVQQVEVNGLIIIHKGKIVFEGYPRMFPTDLHINMLITQVFVSTSVAILEDRGLIDTSKPIDYYFDGLKNSGWEGVPVIDILSMSSGIDRVPLETYEASFDPIKDLALAKSSKPSGAEIQFSNADAMVLTLLVEKISGLTFRDFVEQEIWKKIGAEHSALLGFNTNGTSISYADGMSTTLRDLARFGLAFTPSGRKNANPIISDAHLYKIRDVNKNLKIKSRQTGDTIYSSYQWGAVYEDGDLYKGAHGGQGLYISPSRDLVIAYFGTANIDRERNQLNIISRQLSKSGLFDLD